MVKRSTCLHAETPTYLDDYEGDLHKNSINCVLHKTNINCVLAEGKMSESQAKLKPNLPETTLLTPSELVGMSDAHEALCSPMK